MRAVLLLVPLLCGCIGVQWTRLNDAEPITDEVYGKIEVGDDLGRCLELLGPPKRVWDDATGRFGVSYAWLDQQDVSVRVALPTDFFLNPAFTYGSSKAKWHGIVLMFDADWKLRFKRKGLLSASEAVAEDVVEEYERLLSPPEPDEVLQP